jgi:hypothetical protein
LREDDLTVLLQVHEFGAINRGVYCLPRQRRECRSPSAVQSTEDPQICNFIVSLNGKRPIRQPSMPRISPRVRSHGLEDATNRAKGGQLCRAFGLFAPRHQPGLRGMVGACHPRRASKHSSKRRVYLACEMDRYPKSKKSIKRRRERLIEWCSDFTYLRRRSCRNPVSRRRGRRGSPPVSP